MNSGYKEMKQINLISILVFISLTSVFFFIGCSITPTSIPTQASTPTPTPDPGTFETFIVEKLFELTDAHATLNDGDYQSPLASYNGAIYLAYVDTSSQIKIVKRSASGQVTSTVVMTDVADDRYHMAPSIGIDRDGYIHVTGKMHHDLWQYCVSDNPGDISSFTLIDDNSPGKIPGFLITYPFFQRDKNGVLYSAFRDRIDPPNWWNGYLLGSVARYNADTKTWTMLGGIDYVIQHTSQKCLVWDDSGVDDGAYQGYKIRIMFDVNNRMHMSWNVCRDSTGSDLSSVASHVLYAYSDDGGDTWHKADGTTISTLPISTHNGDILYNVNPGNLYNLTYLCIGLNQNPLVSFVESGGPHYFKEFDPIKRWSGLYTFFDWARQKFVADFNGIITATSVNGDLIYRSFDNGQTWRKYNMPFIFKTLSIFDFMYIQETSDIRIQTLDNNTISVWQIEFSKSELPPT